MKPASKILLFGLWSAVQFTVLAQSKIDSLHTGLAKASNENEAALISKALGYQYMLIGSHDESLAHYGNALAHFTNVKDELMQADIMVGIAETYRNHDIPDKAIEYFLKGATLYEENNRQPLVTSIYNSMIDLFMRQGDIESAKSYAQLAEKILETHYDPKADAELHNNKGRILNNYKDFDSAIYHYRVASAIFDSLKLYHKKGRAMHNMSNSLREKKLYHEALSVCQQVLAIPEINENIKSKIFAILLLADIYNSMGQPVLGIQYARQGLQLAEAYNFKDRERVALLYLSNGYEQMKNYAKAFEYHKRYSNVMNTVYDNTKYEQVARMKTLYETEKQKRTIEIQKANLVANKATIALQESKTHLLIFGIGFSLIIGVLLILGYIHKEKQNKLLVKQKLEIQKQNQEREVLLKEIHHRVKNNLQVISSLLSMQSRKMEEGESKMAVREGQTRIKSMSLIHQKLYSEDSLSKINMKEYIEELSEFLFKSYKPGHAVRRVVESEDLLLDVDQAVPLGLIINELISNALKYAFQPDRAGQLTVSFGKRDHDFVLEVADTGKGLPNDFTSSQSMGMNLVSILVKQLNGNLVIDPSAGARFKIEFSDKTAA